MKNIIATVTVCLFFLMSGLPRAQALDAPLEGTWAGTLDVGSMNLTLVFNLERESNGRMSGTLDVPEQGAEGIPLSSVGFNDGIVSINVDAIGGVFGGAMNDAQDAIDGTWRQGGQSLPLKLELRAEGSIVGPARPQEPKKPYPYKQELIMFENELAGVTLAGTFTKPEGDGPFPAVVLITGSGPQDRNEAVFGHKPFLVLADYLTRRGIAVLRYDDRGVGDSSGDFAAASSLDFATDVQAAIAYLRSRSDIKADGIGLLGHSEGAMIAPIVANQDDNIAFLVLLAPPAVPGGDLLREQSRVLMSVGGLEQRIIDLRLSLYDKTMDILAKDLSDEEKAEQMTTVYKEGIASLSESEQKRYGLSEEVFTSQIPTLLSGWMQFYVSYDPAEDLSKISCPVLAIYGSNDLQVIPAQNLDPLKAALDKAPTDITRVEELEGLNHLLQTSETGHPSEYGGIPETISPRALELIGTWVEEQF